MTILQYIKSPSLKSGKPMIKMKDENQIDSDNLNEIKVAIYSGTMNKACCSRISF